eukprot:PhM_4_TR1931/c0_g1_i1/m.15715
MIVRFIKKFLSSSTTTTITFYSSLLATRMSSNDASFTLPSSSEAMFDHLMQITGADNPIYHNPNTPAGSVAAFRKFLLREEQNLSHENCCLRDIAEACYGIRDKAAVASKMICEDQEFVSAERRVVRLLPKGCHASSWLEEDAYEWANAVLGYCWKHIVGSHAGQRVKAAEAKLRIRITCSAGKRMKQEQQQQEEQLLPGLDVIALGMIYSQMKTTAAAAPMDPESLRRDIQATSAFGDDDNAKPSKNKKALKVLKCLSRLTEDDLRADEVSKQNMMLAEGQQQQQQQLLSNASPRPTLRELLSEWVEARIALHNDATVSPLLTYFCFLSSKLKRIRSTIGLDDAESLLDIAKFQHGRDACKKGSHVERTWLPNEMERLTALERELVVRVVMPTLPPRALLPLEDVLQWVLHCRRVCTSEQKMREFVDSEEHDDRPLPVILFLHSCSLMPSNIVKGGPVIQGELDCVVYNATTGKVLGIAEIKSNPIDMVTARNQRIKFTQFVQNALAEEVAAASPSVHSFSVRFGTHLPANTTTSTAAPPMIPYTAFADLFGCQDTAVKHWMIVTTQQLLPGALRMPPCLTHDVAEAISMLPASTNGVAGAPDHVLAKLLGKCRALFLRRSKKDAGTPVTVVEESSRIGFRNVILLSTDLLVPPILDGGAAVEEKED